MKNKLVWGLTAIFMVVLISGCGKKTASNKTNQSTSNSGTQVAVEQTNNGNEMEEFATTMKDLMERGKPYECTYVIEAENLVQNGKIYVANKSIRGDVKTKISNMKEQMVYFLTKDDTQYVWSDQSNQGMKITMSEEEQNKLNNQNNSQTDSNNVDLNSKMDFNCKRWQVDNSLFDLPVNIEFADISALTQQMMGAIK